VTPGPPGRERFALLGFAGVACIACCAGPILAFFGGLTVAGLVSSLFIGSAGLVIAAIAFAAWLIVRRGRRGVRTPVAPGPVPVAPPTRKR
jgi:hypothetical protein